MVVMWPRQPPTISRKRISWYQQPQNIKIADLLDKWRRVTVPSRVIAAHELPQPTERSLSNCALHLLSFLILSGIPNVRSEPSCIGGRPVFVEHAPTFSDFWKSDVALGTPPLEKAQEALTALTVFLPFPGPPSAPIPIPAPWYCMHWRCASRHFLLRTDHAPLMQLLNFKSPEGQVARNLTLNRFIVQELFSGTPMLFPEDTYLFFFYEVACCHALKTQRSLARPEVYHMAKPFTALAVI
ncbi:hypothetical protein J6590_031335 [Homalodisca vitripennis]|nr:hypothetical protein J6590_031335 [Homalodisca vitripennis]